MRLRSILTSTHCRHVLVLDATCTAMLVSFVRKDQRRPPVLSYCLRLSCVASGGAPIRARRRGGVTRRVGCLHSQTNRSNRINSAHRIEVQRQTNLLRYVTYTATHFLTYRVASPAHPAGGEGCGGPARERERERERGRC